MTGYYTRWVSRPVPERGLERIAIREALALESHAA